MSAVSLSAVTFIFDNDRVSCHLESSKYMIQNFYFDRLFQNNEVISYPFVCVVRGEGWYLF